MFHNKRITKNLLMERAGLKTPLVREMYHDDPMTDPEEVSEEEVTEGEVESGEDVVTDAPSRDTKVMEFLQAIDSIQELEELYDGLSERMKEISERSKQDAKAMGRLAKRMKR
jgi:hypothetical protein